MPGLVRNNDLRFARDVVIPAKGAEQLPQGARSHGPCAQRLLRWHNDNAHQNDLGVKKSCNIERVKAWSFMHQGDKDRMNRRKFRMSSHGGLPFMATGL